MGGLPRKAWIFLAAVAAAAATLTLTLVARYGAPLSFVGFGLLFFLAEMFPIRRQHAAYSVGHIVIIAALISLGPAGAALAATFGGLVNFVLHSRREWLS